ncbi:hypothetical protein Agabi119p4_4434 [Agaricus bisporus var. burnettii]|uniref:Uncharacterized protein n=1 Tax=Agaricus bisporus var. burnettii TaxID=192524 RepID=A0A8H7KH96_AGABI|nr:hypothetical protein Agabi119p4_4434 [Agaricus bisporus var. burnettii]
MVIDPPPEPPANRTLEAKKKAMAKFGQSIALGPNGNSGVLVGQGAQEREARIWAFMNHKPTDSDLEDDSDPDSDDDDPSAWFEDDQDDGRKGQDIVEPDFEDFSHIIRIDASRMRYSTFYEPRDEGD